jgi:ABC-type sulfate transport system permease component
MKAVNNLHSKKANEELGRRYYEVAKTNGAEPIRCMKRIVSRMASFVAHK